MIRELLLTFAGVTALFALLGLAVALLAWAHDTLKRWCRS